MRASDLVMETASAFNSNRARSLLTILGIVIGIAAVIAMTALIGGIKTALVGELGLSQARVFSVANYYGNGMTSTDVDQMFNDLDDSLEAVSPRAYANVKVSSSTENANGSVSGVYPSYAKIRGLKLTKGRFFTQRESETGARVIVLDENGVKTLFGSQDAQAIGKSVRVNNDEYEVIGVIESSSSSDERDYVNGMVPFLTCAQRLAGSMQVNVVIALAKEGADVDQAAASAKEWVIKRFGVPESEQEDSIDVTTMKSITEQLDTMMASFQLLMTVVASVSLVVGGIGIMNMMLTNVTERIREIGLRKALGARRRDITRQFLLESICLTLAGGVVGIILGYVGAYGLAIIAKDAISFGFGTSVQPTIGLDSVLLVAGICVGIGVLFGYYPARRASRLDPVESLHYQ